MTQPIENREVTATVESVGAVEAGQVQIKIKSQEVGAVRYPIPMFLPESCAPQAGYDYPAVLSRGKLKRDKDGSYDNHYFWNAVEWNGEPVSQQRQQPQQPSAPQAPTQAPQQPVQPRNAQQGRKPPVLDPRQESIEAQVALKSAVELVIAFPPEKGPDTTDPVTLSQAEDTVVDVTRRFRILLAAPREPQVAGEGGQDAEPEEVTDDDPFA